jgi:hypothetical protein
VASLDCRNEILGVFLLLLGGLVEDCDAGDDARNHEEKRDDGPDDAPALGRASVLPGKDARIGAVDFSQNQIVALG